MFTARESLLTPGLWRSSFLAAHPSEIPLSPSWLLACLSFPSISPIKECGSKIKHGIYAERDNKEGVLILVMLFLGGGILQIF